MKHWTSVEKLRSHLMIEINSKRISESLELSTELMTAASKQAKREHRSIPKQIEHWARIGRLAEENPDLPYNFIKGILTGIEESNVGDLTDYKPG